jgi:hypothetical protein
MPRLIYIIIYYSWNGGRAELYGIERCGFLVFNEARGLDLF